MMMETEELYFEKVSCFPQTAELLPICTFTCRPLTHLLLKPWVLLQLHFVCL